MRIGIALLLVPRPARKWLPARNQFFSNLLARPFAGLREFPMAI
jgi:hypothetical protein